MAGLRLIDHFEDAVAHCHDDAALAALIGDAARELGFQFFAVLHHASLVLPDRGLVRLDTYPEAWANEIVGDDLVRTDPVHQACRRTSLGFAWDQLPDMTAIGTAERKMLLRARHHGIGDGFTVPVAIPGEPLASCTFAVRVGTALPVERLLSAEQLGAHAFHAARRLHGFPGRHAGPRLTPRELECLRHIAAGKTDGQMAGAMGISAQTAHQYVKRIRAAYGVTRRAQLVAFALRDALVAFEDSIPPFGGMD